jgi:hypothetical protein
MAVQDLVSELKGTFPTLPVLHAYQLINRAWTRVRDIRLWSWQFIVDAQWFVPALINAGTVSTVSQSTSITVNSTAAAALNAAVLSNPTVGAAIGLGRQIKVGGSNSAAMATNGSIYSILNWDGISTITIDRPFGEGTQTAAPYSVYKTYYEPPILPGNVTTAYDASTIRFLSLTNKSSGYSVSGKRLHTSAEQVNRMDPQRGATGDPYAILPYTRNSLGQPVYELYPSPINAGTLYVALYSRWPNVSNSQDFPQVPYGLVTCVMDLARVFCCQWALGNVATYPELQQTNWVAAAQMYKQDYLDGLRQCLKQDDEIMPQVPFLQGRFGLAFGDGFLQNHDISSLLLR